MADRYLLESGAPDGYLLEDGSGVLLLEVPAEDQPAAVCGDDLEDVESGVLDWFEGLPTAVLAAVTTGIIALALGYCEPAPAEDLDSYTSQVYEPAAAPTTNEAEVGFVSTDLVEPDEVEASVYEPLPTAEFIATDAEQDAALGVDFPDNDDPEPVEDSFIGGAFEDAVVADPGAILQLATDLPEDELTEESVTPYFFDEVTPPLLVEFPPADDDEPTADAVIAYLIEDAATADLTQIPEPVLTDPEDAEEPQEAVIAFLFEDAPAPPEEPAALVLDFPDEPEPEQDIEAALGFVFEDAAAPDLTFIPGWQDDFLSDYQQQRDDADEFTLVATVFDPYAQVDDPPPVIPGVGEYIIRARRRHRR